MNISQEDRSMWYSDIALNDSAKSNEIKITLVLAAHQALKIIAFYLCVNIFHRLIFLQRAPLPKYILINLFVAF